MGDLGRPGDCFGLDRLFGDEVGRPSSLPPPLPRAGGKIVRGLSSSAVGVSVGSSSS